MRKKGPAYRRKKGKRVLTLADLYYRQAGLCKYCHCPMVLGGDGPMKATRDHVHPRSRGGKNAGNLVAACARCNQTKGDQHVREFLRSQYVETV